MSNILDRHPDEFAFVQIHVSDNYSYPWGEARWNFYVNLVYIPNLMYDGHIWLEGGHTEQQYEDALVARLAVPTDVTFYVTGDPVSRQTYRVEAEVCIETGGVAKSMRIYMVQVLDRWPPAESYSRNGFKQAAATEDVSLIAGECKKVVRDFTFDGDSMGDQENIKIIVWAQEPLNSAPPPDRAEVFQAAIMGWPFPPSTLWCDFDKDRDVDMADYTVFMDCYTGPCGTPPCDPPLYPDPACGLGDVEEDGDIDCDDWEGFKDYWTEYPVLPPFYADCDEDCNENSVADEFDIAGPTSEDCQPNGVPDECDLAGGTSPDNNFNHIPDECEVSTPLPEDSLGETCTDDDDCANASKCIAGVCYVAKNRYLSISPNPAQVAGTARRIRLGDGTVMGWVGVPGFVTPEHQPDGFWLANVVASPVYDGIDFVGGWPPVLQVGDCEIAPGLTYEVQAIQSGLDPGDEGMYSQPLVLPPAVWGDVVGQCPGGVCGPPNGIPGLDDILAELGKFQGNDVAPLVWLDIAPWAGGTQPDLVIGVSDVIGCLSGFSGEPYPGDPLDCP